MRELYIHKNSRLFYSDRAQPFVYLADSLEIALFCCEGIQIDQKNVSCHIDDMCILEELQIHTFHVPSNARILITKVPLHMKEGFHQFYQSFFQHEEIKSLCILIANQNGVDTIDELLLQSYVSKLGYLVLNHYSYHSEHMNLSSLNSNDERMKLIHRIIYEQSKEDLSLVSLANQLHLTPQYVSQFFKTYFGCTFLHYVANVRLYKAMNDIQHSTKSFLTIAMDYGFANVRSFQLSFSNAYHCTPKQYRKKLQQRTIFEIQKSNDPVYATFMKEQLSALPTHTLEQKEETYQISIDANAKGIVLQHTWRRLLTVGRARLLLIDDIRKQLIEIQKDITFQMIRFHGIFNDDMHVYDEDEQGNPIYNFHQVNDILDFLLNIGLKPFIELGFMPKKLALNPDLAIIDRMFIVSPPKDIKKWQGLVQAFIKNCINRYGEEEVYSWYFEFWNNGGLDFDSQAGPRNQKFWQGTLEEYLQFYEATYHSVKSIHPSLRIGGPSCSTILITSYPKNFETYIQYMKKHKCMIDFVTFHIYPNYQGDLTGSYSTELLPFHNRLEEIQKWMKRQKLQIELHITEWSTWGYKEHPGFNDTCEKALYLLQSMVNTIDQIDSIGHWTFSDYTETMKTKQNNIFCDNAGLITSNGIKKAAYHAYTLLRKLGDQELDKGNNYIFTKKHKNFQLLLFHYQHQRDEKATTACFHMKLLNIPNGTYEKKVTYLNKESGSSYDMWKKMGSRLEIMEEDVQYLKASSLMYYERETLHINQHKDEENRILKNEEAILIEWIYKY